MPRRPKPKVPAQRRRTTIGKPDVPTCETTGKRRYRELKQAQSALRDLRRRHGKVAGSTRKLEKRAYLCGLCDGWHLTSQNTTPPGRHGSPPGPPSRPPGPELAKSAETRRGEAWAA